jgi:cytochrome oxidase Cu insertion factor (SCO1/SenC/PrrC family)
MMGDRLKDRRQGRLLVVLAVLFFAPLGLSFYLYYGRDWHPGGRVNAGVLIEPAKPLPELALPTSAGGVTDAQFLKGKWTYLHVQQGRCTDDCQRHLYDTRQVRTALDRDMNRVQRVFIGDEGCCDMQALHAMHPDLIAIRASAADAELLALLPRGAGEQSGRIYLIDPLGNLMMFYAAGANPKGMLEDMKRLLGLSHIG